MNSKAYHIGTVGQKWNEKEKQAWYEQVLVKRLYQQEVVSKIQALTQGFEVFQKLREAKNKRNTCLLYFLGD